MRPLFRMAFGMLWLGYLAIFVIAGSREGSAIWPFFVFMVPGYGSVGVLLATRRPRNSVGWLVLAASVLGGLSLMLPDALDGWRVVFPVMAGLFGLILRVFPDGRLLSRRWRTFNPLRCRVQATVDLRFNRSRYDAHRVMDQFSESPRDTLDPSAIVRGWI